MNKKRDFDDCFNSESKDESVKRHKDSTGQLQLMSIGECLADIDSDIDVSASKGEEECQDYDYNDVTDLTNLLVKRKLLDRLRIDSDTIPSTLLGFQSRGRGGCFYNKADYLVDELIRKSCRPRFNGTSSESKNGGWDDLPASLGPHPLADRALILRTGSSGGGNGNDYNDMCKEDNAMATEIDENDNDDNNPDFYDAESPRQVATNTHSGKLSHSDFIIDEVKYTG